MKLLLRLILSFFCFNNFIFFACNEQKSLPHCKIKAIATDWDNVVSQVDSWQCFKDLARVIMPNLLALRKFGYKPSFWWDVKDTWYFALKDENGNILQGAPNYLDYFARTYDPVFATVKDAMVDVFTTGVPIASTINLYKRAQLPVVVWTNNDRIAYEKKYVNITNQLMQPFQVQGRFVAGYNSNMPTTEYNVKGKPDPDYFRKAYEHTKSIVPLKPNEYVLFIDDFKENVQGACDAADQYGLNIVSLQFNSVQQLERDVSLLLDLKNK